ncbi:MAG: MFS transporter [Acidobacteria bacterium]|nr:MFS transporter [Acidobacteriota bacterium]
MKNSDAAASASRLSVKEKIGYGLGDAASNLYFQTIMLYVMFFYTDVFGLSAAAVGTMFLITRIWDAVNDPIMGMIADRTQSRWGKFRPYILSLSPLLAIVGVFAFFTPGFGAGGKLFYAYGTYTLLWMLYTAVNVPYSSLMGVITPNSLERTEVSQYRFVLAFGGQFIVSGATLPLVLYFGKGDEQSGWAWTMGAFGILAVVLLSITFFTTRERVHPPEAQKADAKQDLKDLFRNRPWVLIAAATVFQLLFAVMRGNSIPYFFKYYVLEQKLLIFSYAIHLSVDGFISSFAAVGSVATIIGAVLAKVFAKTLDKKNTYSGFLIAAAVISCGFYFLEPHNVLFIFGLNGVVSFLMGAVSVLQWAIYADTADYGEWKFGRRATGLVMAASLFALKLGLAFGGTFVGWILQYHGFAANADQTQFATAGIRMLMSFYPAVFGVIGGLVMASYPLKNSIMQKIEEDLAARRR